LSCDALQMSRSWRPGIVRPLINALERCSEPPQLVAELLSPPRSSSIERCRAISTKPSLSFW
jgi:hypothetical protein